MGVLQLTPLSLTAASAVFLGARVGWRRWLAVAVGLLGALLVIKPSSGAFNAWALLVVLSVLCGKLRDISIRRLDGSISPLVIMMLSQSAVALVSLPTLPFEPWVWPTALQFTQIAVAAACTLIGHFGSSTPFVRVRLPPWRRSATPVFSGQSSLDCSYGAKCRTF